MKEAEILKRIYPSVVTYVGDWQRMLAEAKRLKLTTISLFITAVNFKERQELYKLLETAGVLKIPHVHLRNDVKEKEIDFFVNQYQTKVFTIHHRDIKYFWHSKHRKKFYVENGNLPDRIEDMNYLKHFGGICLDLSHHQDYHLVDLNQYNLTKDLSRKYKIGCNHISACIPGQKSRHYAKNFSELKYVAAMPQRYFSRYINFEIANPISQQLIFRKQLAKLLAKTWK